MSLRSFRFSGAVGLTTTVAAFTLAIAQPVGATITVNFNQGASLQADASNAIIVAAFQKAANNWTNVFTNTFTFNLNIDFATLGAGTIASAGSNRTNYSYSSYRGALAGGLTKSADDLLALNSLTTDTSFDRLINRTSDNPSGSGSATAYTDDSQSSVQLTNANAKAVGLMGANNAAVDSSLSFNNLFRSSFDFDPTDGITTGLFDFVGVATHEIGHALGFISGVDILDGNSPPSGGPFSARAFSSVSSLDLFRYSTASATAGTNGSGIIDWTASRTDKYFSLDNGKTKIASFATGVNFGDGSQASHWKDDGTGNNASSLNPGYIGVMDPTAPRGLLLPITGADLRAFDVIGYTLVPAQAGVAPEPGSLALLLPVLGAVGLVLRRRKK